MQIHTNVLSTIGATPLVELKRLYPQAHHERHSNRPVSIYGKLEALNPGGSIKDRTSIAILRDAMNRGLVAPGGSVIESSSGNMAIGLAQACVFLGLRLIVVVDRNLNSQTAKILEAYGAQLEWVCEPDPHDGYLGARLRRVKHLLARIPNSYWPNQYANPLNPATHVETMREIVDTLERPLDYLLVATSTCGTLMGCARYVREAGLSTKIIAVDAVGSLIFGKRPAKRLIPGHGAGRPSQLLDERMIHGHIQVDDLGCVHGCRHLLQREAILAGGSSGALVTALGQLLPGMAPDSTCALILCDRGERYLDTIYSDAWVAEQFEHQLPKPRRLTPTYPRSQNWAPTPLAVASQVANGV